MSKLLLALCLFVVNTVYANNQLPVEFFVSNNNQIIDLQTAYNRLTGKEQIKLENNMIHLLQKNHIEQGKFENVLGTYHMASSNQLTADNTEHFYTSPYQSLRDEDIFSLAQALAINLKQESVAVLIPYPSEQGSVTVHFISHKPTIAEITNQLHEQLPDSYNQAFSLHLMNTSGDFNHAKVADVEWLGSELSPDEIKKAFPLEKVSVHYGKVFLVYQDGSVTPL